MNRNVLLLSVSLLGWIALSCVWYTCRIKGTCNISKHNHLSENQNNRISEKSINLIDSQNLNLQNTTDTIFLETTNKFENEVKEQSKSDIPVPKKAITVPKVPCPTIILSGTTPIINDVIFSETSSQIVCTNTLKQFAQAVKVYLGENKGSIEIVGYTDNGPKPINNFTLGLERALSVKLLLIKEGIPAEIITANSKGDKEPIADNSSSLGRLQNSRVSILIK